jgi:acyl-CoA thioester hydrolase
MIRSVTEVTVRYSETDMMGIVYHANYLAWFEIGRTHLLKELGLPYRQLEADGYFLPVLEVAAKYLRPAVYDDTLTIVTVMRESPLLRIRLEYEVKRGGELIATGSTVHAFIDREGRPVRPPASVAAKMNEVLQAKAPVGPGPAVSAPGAEG